MFAKKNCSDVEEKFSISPSSLSKQCPFQILHHKLHLGQKDFVCTVCHRTYFTKSGLQAHMRQLHAPPSSKDQTNPSGFSCKHCQEKCPTRYDLMMHRKTVHAGTYYTTF